MLSKTNSKASFEAFFLNMNDVLKKFQLSEKDNFLFHKGKIIGFINPGAFISFHKETGSVEAYGALGYCTLNSKDKASDAINKLAANRFILPCQPHDRSYLLGLLENNVLSRSNSYLLNFVDDVAELKSLLHNISSYNILILGCGGIGTNVVYLLAGLGFKHFILVDGDTIEASNLNRQVLYRKADAGKFKCTVLARELKKRFDGLSLKTVSEFMTHQDYSAYKPDMMILSADNPPDLIDVILRQNSKMPVFHSGYEITNGVINFYKGVKPGKKEVPQQIICPGITIAPSSGPLNYKVASLTVEYILHYLLTGDVPKKRTMLYQDFSL